MCVESSILSLKLACILRPNVTSNFVNIPYEIFTQPSAIGIYTTMVCQRMISKDVICLKNYRGYEANKFI